MILKATLPIIASFESGRISDRVRVAKNRVKPDEGIQGLERIPEGQ
ncbi:MAG: hypothetical protein KIS30_04550 [Thermoplasmata archaeon]|nr:hypothetical protein [Candidatus Sysuiplasma acidicola]MBX8646012.1 hypothetical protein [Candidatus Sysuiplasma acidicola]